ncbi:MAG: hypothetical protein RLY31_1729 [Bacteroidota bacterium]|jgi:hypothetical protein
MKNVPACLLLSFFLSVLSACSTKAPHTSVGNPAQTAFQSLADYLRRDPKVRVTEVSGTIVVYIRGADTITGNVEPLFVIDGSAYADRYEEAARLVVIEEVQSVRVLNAAEGSAQFGLRGANGVVLVRTRGGR